MVKGAITQPNYLPWLGYFELLDKVDKWIVLDDVQIVKRSFIVRNKVKNENDKESWLTLRVKKGGQKDQIRQSFVDSSFVVEHLNILNSYYRKSKYFDETIALLNRILHVKENEYTVSEYNTRVNIEIAKSIGITLNVDYSSKYHDQVEFESPEQKIIDLCKITGIEKYYNFKAGLDLGIYNPDNFRKKNIEIYKQDYIHPTYNGSGFNFKPYMSIVDLLFHCGIQDCLSVIRKGSNWIRC